VRIRKENLRICREPMNPKEALLVIGQLLLDCGSIKPQYVEDIFRSYEQFGPYFVIAPSIALAHAQPSESVLADDIALVICKTPVSFGSHNDPVRLLFGLCSRESHQHIENLAELASILADDEVVQALANAEDIDALYVLLSDTGAGG